jgi:hypothetical protein
LRQAADEIQNCIDRGNSSYFSYENYRRIFVGTRTLASWIQSKAAELTENQHTIFATAENMLPGQISYTFTLDLKPSLDVKYSYMALVVSPFVPELTISQEHSAAFSFVLNTPDAATTLTAKTGNTCNKDVPGANCKQ